MIYYIDLKSIVFNIEFLNLLELTSNVIITMILIKDFQINQLKLYFILRQTILFILSSTNWKVFLIFLIVLKIFFFNTQTHYKMIAHFELSDIF
jgi:hypothetical protein